MRFLNLDGRLKHRYRAAGWRSSILAARVTGHPSYEFFDKKIRSIAGRLGRITVLPSHDVIFFAIPKNANSKTRRILSEIRGVRNPFTRSERKKFRRCPSAKEIPIQEFHRILNSQNRLSFAIVRNPYARIVSAWSNKFRDRPLVSEGALQKPKPEVNTYLRLRASIDKSLPAGADATLSFDQYLTYVASIIGKWEDPHIEPQTSFLDIPFIPIDRMIRLESYARDMVPILDHMKAPESIYASLGVKINPSGMRQEDYAAITPEQKRKIEALYGEDIARFGY